MHACLSISAKTKCVYFPQTYISTSYLFCLIEFFNKETKFALRLTWQKFDLHIILVSSNPLVSCELFVWWIMMMSRLISGRWKEQKWNVTNRQVYALLDSDEIYFWLSFRPHDDAKWPATSKKNKNFRLLTLLIPIKSWKFQKKENP